MRTILLLIASLMSLATQAYEPTIVRDDRIWTYCFEEHFYSQTSQKFLNCKFDGTEQHGDYTYHRLKYWYVDEGENTAKTVALMREDSRGVYILLEQTSINADNAFNQDVIVPENTEAILYDFYAETGEIKTRIMDFKGFREDEYDIGSPLRMKPEFTLGFFEYKKFPTTINGRNFQVCEMGSVNDYLFGNEYLDHSNSLSICDLGIYAREIGNIGRGLLHYMSMSPRSTGEVYTNCYFVRQIDLTGNVLFDTAWLDKSHGISAPEETSISAVGKSYDMTGKEVENPESGTIYIRDGKKHIAR